MFLSSTHKCIPHLEMINCLDIFLCKKVWQTFMMILGVRCLIEIEINFINRDHKHLFWLLISNVHSLVCKSCWVPCPNHFFVEAHFETSMQLQYHVSFQLCIFKNIGGYCSWIDLVNTQSLKCLIWKYNTYQNWVLFYDVPWMELTRTSIENILCCYFYDITELIF